MAFLRQWKLEVIRQVQEEGAGAFAAFTCDDTDLSSKAHTLVTRATTEMLRAVLEQQQKIACKRVELVAGYPVAMFQLCVSGSETQ